MVFFEDVSTFEVSFEADAQSVEWRVIISDYPAGWVFMEDDIFPELTMSFSMT